MRLLLRILILVSLNASAQTKYLAVYESKMNLDFSNLELSKKPLQFTIDSSHQMQQDSLLELVDTAIIKEAIQKMFGGPITIYSRVEADSVSATLEAYQGSGRVNVNSDSLFYRNGKWSYGSQKNHKDLEIWPEKFTYTGSKKKILDYTCYEAVTQDGPGGTVVWVCKELPQTVSPGITTQNLNCAVFEYSNPKAGLNFTIKSLKKNIN